MGRYLQRWQQKGWDILWSTLSPVSYLGLGTSVCVVWSVVASRWGPGWTKYLGQIAVCYKIWPSGTPGTTKTITWSWVFSWRDPEGASTIPQIVQADLTTPTQASVQWRFFFASLHQAVPKKPVHERAHPSWISEDTWQVIYTMVSLPISPNRYQRCLWNLGHKIRLLLSGERRRRATEGGTEPVTFTKIVNMKHRTDITSSVARNVINIDNIHKMRIIFTVHGYFHKMRIISTEHGYFFEMRIVST